MQLPNLARCSRNYLPAASLEYGTSMEDQSNLLQWLRRMMKFEEKSHLRGTCLLTGQQATVDMTSNYKTSMTLFSSVNVGFMLAVVLWITASFAVFYIGGAPKIKTTEEMDNNNWTSDDILMLIAILWNVVLIIIIMIPDVQRNSNVPLNNVVIAVVALLASIFVQWQWANFHAHDTDTKDSVSAQVQGRGYTPNVPYKARDEEYPQESRSMFQNEKGAMVFNTSNFLSTASAFQKYGVQYSKIIAGNSLRKRKTTTTSIIAKMPNYTAMIDTGSPIVLYNYIQNIKVRF